MLGYSDSVFFSTGMETNRMATKKAVAAKKPTKVDLSGGGGGKKKAVAKKKPAATKKPATKKPAATKKKK